MGSRRSAGWLSACLVLLLIGWTSATPAEAAATARWAWVVVRDPLASSPLPSKDRGNSSGGVNSFVRIFDTPGWYGVILPGVQPLAGESGNVLVSALGKKPRVCVSHEVQVFVDEVQLQVLCFTRTGSPADSGFIVNWLAASGQGGRLAYATDFSPTSNCGTPSHQYHSSGETLSSCPLPAQRARVVIPGLGSFRGTVQVSARATRADVGGASAGFCGVAGFGPGSSGEELIDSQCFEPGGTGQIYRTFTVWFMQGLGMKGIVRSNVAYLLAHRPKASSYVPDAGHRYSSAGKTGRVERLGRGRYRALLPGMPKGGSAQVTPFGTAVRHCVIDSIEKRSIPQRVGVRCFDADGVPADTRFLLAYAK